MIIKKGNLFSSDCKVIAHGVNCKGAFGSGVAGQIAELYPEVRKAYLDKHKSEGWKLGDTQIVSLTNLKGGREAFIANCATQNSYGRSGIHIDYDALSYCMNKVFTFAEQLGHGVAIPWIGTGLAGGDKEMVRIILQQCYQGRELYLEIWEL